MSDSEARSTVPSSPSARHKRRRAGVWLAVLSAGLLSCASAVTPESPLVGRWSEQGLGPDVQIVMTLSADGSLTIAATYVNCSGALTIRGTWTATPTTLTFVTGPCVSTLAPQPACAIPCGTSMPGASDPIAFTLSDHDSTLTLRHSDDATVGATWMRIP